MICKQKFLDNYVNSKQGNVETFASMYRLIEKYTTVFIERYHLST